MMVHNLWKFSTFLSSAHRNPYRTRRQPDKGRFRGCRPADQRLAPRARPARARRWVLRVAAHTPSKGQSPHLARACSPFPASPQQGCPKGRGAPGPPRTAHPGPCPGPALGVGHSSQNPRRVSSACPGPEESSRVPDCSPGPRAAPCPPRPRSLELVGPRALDPKAPERGREGTRGGRALPW